MRLRFPERLGLVDVILWALRIGIVVFVATGTWATLSKGVLGFEGWR